MKKKSNLFVILIALIGLITIAPGCHGEKQAWDSGLEVGAVAASNQMAVEAGQEILESGGNAVDAAIAVSFALNVAEPFASGIGGGGFMLVFPAGEDPVFIDYRERAPAAARGEMFTDLPLQEKIYDGLSVAVPGQLRGMEEASTRFGTKDMAELISPAIKLAGEGITVTPVLADAFRNHWDTLSSCEELKDIYLADGVFPYEEGQTLTQPLLAETLTILAEKGFNEFYRGELADDILAAVETSGGIMNAGDLKDYDKARVASPFQGEFGPYTLYSSPLPSAGGLSVHQLLNIWSHYPEETTPEPHLEEIFYLIEAMKIVMEDRDNYLGDFMFVDVPLDELASEDYITEKAEAILNREVNPGGSEGEEGSTTSFVTADNQGNVVVVTQTLNYFLGSQLAVPGRGFILNNQMANFSSDPESPNAPAGGKTPLSSMSPTIFVKDGEPVLALGSPGARRIISSVFQVALNYLARDLPLDEAVQAPRFHFEAEVLTVDEEFAPGILQELEEEGFTLFIRNVGSINAMAWREGIPSVYADQRREGHIYMK